MNVNAYAAPAAGQPLAPTVIERREVGAKDVLIQIEYAGICHSDIHTVNGDWGPQAPYSSSVTWSSQVTTRPCSSASWIATCAMKRAGVAPCQCSSPGSM